MSNLKIDSLDDETIQEVASFLGMSFGQCKERLLKFDDGEMADEWRRINPKTPEEIIAFYKNTNLYILDLTQANASNERRNFHGDVVKYLMDNFPPSRNPLVLDYGSGVGEEVIRFSSAGYKVSYCDIPGRTAEFLGYRLGKRNLTAEFIPIGEGAFRLEKKFDIIFLFDVLEHTPDPLKILNMLVKHLSPNGVMAIINCPHDDGNHPCHLASTFSILGNNWSQTLDYVGLVPLDGESRIYRKAKLAKLFICRVRYFIWRMTSLYVIRVPKG